MLKNNFFQVTIQMSIFDSNKFIRRSSFLAPTDARQIAVRNAMAHAWKAYRTYAWGSDELKSLSKMGSSWFGLGLTIVDSIDTLYIMNLTEGLT